MVTMFISCNQFEKLHPNIRDNYNSQPPKIEATWLTTTTNIKANYLWGQSVIS